MTNPFDLTGKPQTPIIDLPKTDIYGLTDPLREQESLAIFDKALLEYFSLPANVNMYILSGKKGQFQNNEILLKKQYTPKKHILLATHYDNEGFQHHIVCVTKEQQSQGLIEQAFPEFILSTYNEAKREWVPQRRTPATKSLEKIIKKTDLAA